MCAYSCFVNQIQSLLIFLSLVSAQQFTTVNVKSSVTLNSVTSSTQGAQISTGSASTASVSGSGWWVNSGSYNQFGWHLETTLDDTWGFHPQFPSTVSINIDLTSPTTDVFVGFQVPGSGVWTVIRSRTNQQVRISPNSCPASSQNSGDLEALPNGNIYSDLSVTGATGYTSLTSQAIPSVLQFTIRNDPAQGVSFEYAGSGSCTVSTPMVAASGLKVYFVLLQGGTVQFNSITLSYSYELTLAPTTDPTSSPTSPTSNPSTSPTKNPTTETAQPSQFPTLSPTQPTLNPSQSPTETTSAPTQNPSTTPTKVPTRSPSSHPTQSPTHVPTGQPSQSPTDPPRETTIIGETAWNDDYLIYPANAAGWDTYDMTGSRVDGMLFAAASYHGAFSGDTDAAVDDIETSSTDRTFKCLYRSTLSVSYDYLHCGLESTDYFDFLFNDVSQNQINGALTSLSCVAVDSAVDTPCGDPCSTTAPWNTVATQQLTDFATVMAGEEFKISFVAVENFNNDGMLLTNLQIQCNRIITQSPTADPTTGPPTTSPLDGPSTSPTPRPTVHPSGSPSKAPSTSPSNSPSASPSDHPSLSPTTNPTPSPTSPGLTGKDVIWYESMSSTFTASSDWNIDRTITLLNSTTTLCPLSTDSCWQLSAKTTQTPEIHRVDSTINYRNVSLIYSVATDQISSAGESCQISFSTDTATNSDWTAIANITDTESPVIDAIYDLPQSAWDNQAVGIKISLTNTDRGSCQLRNWYLVGVPINTDNPTTALVVTTAKPSASPTQDGEAVIPTPSPTLDEDTQDDDNDDQAVSVTGSLPDNLYLIIGGASVCILCGLVIAIFVCCKKRNKGKAIIDDNAAKMAPPAPPATAYHAHGKKANGGGYVATGATSPHSVSSANDRGFLAGSGEIPSTAQILQMTNIAAETHDEEQGMKHLAASMKAQQDFGTNLSSLAGANNMLLDDVVDALEHFEDDVDDIANVDDDDDDGDGEVMNRAMARGTAGGPDDGYGAPSHATAGGPSVADLDLDDEEEDDGDQEVIGGMQTLR